VRVITAGVRTNHLGKSISNDLDLCSLRYEQDSLTERVWRWEPQSSYETTLIKALGDDRFEKLANYVCAEGVHLESIVLLCHTPKSSTRELIVGGYSYRLNKNKIYRKKVCR
jgi:hypothetical protein